MKLPDFSFENKAIKKGYKVIAGMDEVGRGAFAGPVVAGCVVLNKQIGLRWDPLITINDSKKLSPKQREAANIWIRNNALTFGIGKASVTEINRFGIKKATEMAFRRAIKNCDKKIDYLLIDAFYIPYIRGLRRKNQNPLIKGDSLSISIAAASIIAKVYRDTLMTKLSKNPKYRKYKWDENKGYGTLSHRKPIDKYGLTRLHRKKFVETYINNSSSSQVE